MDVFSIACAVIFVLSLYLAIASCYRTGFGGVIGCGLMALGSGIYLWSALVDGYSYKVPKELIAIIVGMGFFLLQHAMRVVYHATREKLQASHEDAARALHLAGGTDMERAEQAG